MGRAPTHDLFCFNRKLPTRKKAAAALVKRRAMCPRRRRLRSARDELHRHALAVCRGGGETSGLSAAQSGYAPEAKPALASEPNASRPLRILTRTAPWLCS